MSVAKGARIGADRVLGKGDVRRDSRSTVGVKAIRRNAARGAKSNRREANARIAESAAGGADRAEEAYSHVRVADTLGLAASASGP